MRPSEALEKHRDEVRAVIARFGAVNPRLFGSVARGDDVDGSDMDIVLELPPTSSYYDVFRMEDALSELLGVRVDISTPGRPGTRFAAELARDAISL